ncbi:Trep_Strep domain-containing protein [Xylanibacillus composti]|uniref:Trep_Strep domain-containing protein n=1 Tax=Xylanibacillus composti TaxID=1572762 RepID=A0A8J4M477_9BACL|nr:MptD family putative ECF transporter S component [Xylanibacillus composti]MDT9724560.1 Trep_Strep domain-containing protein [Xylanibacillus composti]GIQ70281.1 hypothetical protein XYCOK13_31050 [Xylanibacillus composti]
MQAQAQSQVHKQNTTVHNRWRMRDFITLAIFNVVMMIILTVGGMFAHPIAYLVGAGVVALFNGPIYMVMANKIGKRGVLFFSSLLVGLYFMAFGFVYFLITLALIGILCELVMWGSDTYKNPVRNAIGYGLFYVGYSLCGVVPIVFFKEQYVAILEQSYSPDKLGTLLYYYGTPGMVLTMCAISFAGGLAGCYIGNTLLKKHVAKARLV